MKFLDKRELCFLVVWLFASPVYSQDAGSAGDNKFNESFRSVLENVRRSLEKHDKESAKLAVVDLSAYSMYLVSDDLHREFLSEAEKGRLDKQVGTNGNSSGSTSLTSTGSTPSLLGFALEHGGLTQSTDGNTITFRGNLANSIRALMDTTYEGSYKLGENDPLVTQLAKLSFSVSFDTSGNSSSTAQGFSPTKQNLSGYSFQYQIYNHRDPRDKKYRDPWQKLLITAGVDVSNALTILQVLLREKREKAYADWRMAARSSIDALPDDASKPDIQRAVQTAADSFKQLFGADQEVMAAITTAVRLLNSYVDGRNQILSNIRKTPLATIEYNNNRQLTTNNQNIVATQPMQRLPSLSNVNLVLAKGFVGANSPALTVNLSTTWFNSSDPTAPRRGRVRDYRASLQLDVPLRELRNIGKPVLSFSGEFLGLLEEPLGQKVMLNGVTIDRRGNMGIFQSKLSIPVKDSGIKIPISFTYASRTELIKEKDVRGNIGITFDLDTLFSKAK
jgi:hypothetical protein